MNVVKLSLGIGLCLIHIDAEAAQITYQWTSRAVTPLESTATPANTEPAPVNGRVLSFFVTTDADIFSIGFIKFEILPGSPPGSVIYQSSIGNDHSPPPPVLVAVFPAFGADSYIDTPGPTVQVGGGLPGDGTANTLWDDLSNNGPQNNFKFAQITVPQGTIWRFTGNVFIDGATSSQIFHFSVPEPGSITIALIATAALVRRRRADPPA